MENNVEKSQRGVKIFLLIILYIFLLAVGFGAGVWFSSKTNYEVKNTQTNTQEPVKVSKKIDESKPWVYEADYSLNSENKDAVEMFGEKFSSKDSLKAPYVNINSEYGKRINTDIQKLYEDLYSRFGTKISEELTQASELKFESYNTDKILSLIITYREGILNSGWTNKYIIYNINLDTLSEASYEEVYKECGFQNENDVKKYADITLNNLIYDDIGYSDSAIDYSKFFIKDKKLNFLMPNPAGVLTPIVVENGVKAK